MRFKVISKTEDKGSKFNVDTKQWEEHLLYNVALECRPGNGDDGKPTSISGRIDLKYISRINAAGFVVGGDVHVEFLPAESKPGELVGLPDPNAKVPTSPPTGKLAMAGAK